MLKLLELLRLRKLEPDPGRTKLVRHKDATYDVDLLKRQGWLEAYQQFQARAVFDGCDLVLVFVAEEGSRSRFFGAFDVGARSPAEASNNVIPARCPYKEWAAPGNVHYALSRRVELADFEDRLIIDWGDGARAWHQWLRDKPVVEVAAAGRSLTPFRDYLRVTLTHAELVELVNHAAAHRDWQTHLRSVGGIDLILASQTGQQYVGSATGIGGIWQRWCEYAASGHGGNRRLRELMSTDLSYPDGFVFSVLHTFSRTTAREEALALEAFFKEKLGSRAVGLNAN